MGRMFEQAKAAKSDLLCPEHQMWLAFVSSTDIIGDSGPFHQQIHRCERCHFTRVVWSGADGVTHVQSGYPDSEAPHANV